MADVAEKAYTYMICTASNVMAKLSSQFQQMKFISTEKHFSLESKM